MVAQTIVMENTADSNGQKLVQVRQKIKDVFGGECTMKDDVLVKRYAMTSDGELIMILR
ncbi:MAG: hypothetical protein NTZ37_09600 [Methanoregula sp.]|jgi:hypothetical protein|nr:hypothetical protein [Methanoregula sp.]